MTKKIAALAAALDVSHRPLVVVGGSGPFGEQVADAQIHTLDLHPAELDLTKTIFDSVCSMPRRTDLDIGSGGLAFFIESIMSPDEADALAATTERMGYSRYAPAITTPPGMRQNQACHWIASEHNADALLRPLYARFSHLLPQEIDGAALHPQLSHRLAHYKYNDGDVFNMHTDGCWPGQSINKAGNGIQQWHGVESKLSMLLYLNDQEDGFSGGETRLFPRHRGAAPVDVKPKKGGALFFRHGFGQDSVMHMGMKVGGATPKYVLRLNVLYDVA